MPNTLYIVRFTFTTSYVAIAIDIRVSPFLSIAMADGRRKQTERWNHKKHYKRTSYGLFVINVKQLRRELNMRQTNSTQEESNQESITENNTSVKAYNDTTASSDRCSSNKHVLRKSSTVTDTSAPCDQDYGNGNVINYSSIKQ